MNNYNSQEEHDHFECGAETVKGESENICPACGSNNVKFDTYDVCVIDVCLDCGLEE